MTCHTVDIDRNVYENLTEIIYEWSRLNTTCLMREYVMRCVPAPISLQIQDLIVGEVTSTFN